MHKQLQTLSEILILNEGNISLGRDNLFISAYPKETFKPPHFHIHTRIDRGVKDKKGFECCVEFKTAKYANHGSINGKLNRIQKDQLNKILRRNNNEVWKRLCNDWNSNPDSNMKMNQIPVIPDYTKLQ